MMWRRESANGIPNGVGGPTGTKAELAIIGERREALHLCLQVVGEISLLFGQLGAGHSV